MSGPTIEKSYSARVIQAVALIVVFGLLFLATRVAPEAHGVVGTLAALGFLLLAGTLTSELCELLSLPHLSGYLLAGVIAGPYVLGLIDHETVTKLAPVNSLALALIALAGGCSLDLESLASAKRSLGWATLLQSTIVPVTSAVAFFAFAPFTPFRGASVGVLVALAALWGGLSASRSPAAILGILSQLQPKGVVTSFSVAFVMASNLVVIVLSAVVIALVRPLLNPAATVSFDEIRTLAEELLGSAALGVCLGIVVSVYLRIVGRNQLLVLLAIGLGLSELLSYIQFDALLAFLIAGFYVRNFSAQGPKLVSSIQQTGAVVFVVFFALAGAHLDLGVLRSAGLVTLGLCIVRGAATWGATRLSGRLADDPPAVRDWGWSGLVAQAGLTLGIAVKINQEFPGIGPAFGTIALSAIAINEVVGPILFKIALDRSGESYQAAAEGPASAG